MMMLTRGRVFPCRARVAVCPLISRFMFVARVQFALLSDSGPFPVSSQFPEDEGTVDRHVGRVRPEDVRQAADYVVLPGIAMLLDALDDEIDRGAHPWRALRIEVVVEHDEAARGNSGRAQLKVFDDGRGVMIAIYEDEVDADLIELSPK